MNRPLSRSNSVISRARCAGALFCGNFVKDNSSAANCGQHLQQQHATLVGAIYLDAWLNECYTGAAKLGHTTATIIDLLKVQKCNRTVF